MSQGDLQLIQNIMAGLARNPVAHFSYTQDAFDNDDVDGVEVFDVRAQQNIPSAGRTDYNPSILNKGVRAQGASIPRLGWNHYIGRSSFNLNKLIQKLQSFFGVHRASLAHNANEYDANAQYRTGDICYTTDAVNNVKVYSWHQRISLTPEVISNVAPNAALHWQQMQEKTSHSSLLPFSAPGFKHKYTIVDLTAPSYQTNRFYPAVTGFNDFILNSGDAENNAVQVQFEAFCNGQIGGAGANVRAELSVLSRFTGFADSSTDILLNHSHIDAAAGTVRGLANIPIGFSKLVKGRQAVVWLRGGARYALWNSFGSGFTVYNSQYSNGLDADAVAPTPDLIFALAFGRFKARVKTVEAADADDAVPKSQIDGALPLPKTIAANASLRNVRAPGSYIVVEPNVAATITDGPVGASGPFDLTVSGDKAGLSVTTQRMIMRGTGDEYTRTLAGGVIVVNWYLSTSPNRDVAFSGLYKFGIVNGDLLMYYHAGDEVPDFYINDGGELIAAFD